MDNELEELSQSQFDAEYRSYVLKYAAINGISYNTALEGLHDEYRECKTANDWGEWMEYIDDPDKRDEEDEVL